MCVCVCFFSRRNIIYLHINIFVTFQESVTLLTIVFFPPTTVKSQALFLSTFSFMSVL